MAGKVSMGSFKAQVFSELEPLVQQLEELARREDLIFTAANRKQVPSKPGVYAIYRDGVPVYVGETGNLKSRLFDSHKRGQSSAFWGKLQKEDRSRTDNDIEEIVLRHCTFRFVELGDSCGSGSSGGTYVARRRLEAFVQAVYQPKLNFLPVKEVKGKRGKLLERLDEASERGDGEEVIRLASELKELR
ncbi:MAG: hypothetical protein V3U26_00215 [Dehalococcoidia bacterium]